VILIYGEKHFFFGKKFHLKDWIPASRGNDKLVGDTEEATGQFIYCVKRFSSNRSQTHNILLLGLDKKASSLFVVPARSGNPVFQMKHS
jgi:hypothetical protein